MVIGAGQAGLSSSFHLRRRGIEHVVLDSNAEAGGAWQHRWRSLTMRDVHGVAALPELDVPIGSDREPARTFVPAYFRDYEQTYDLPILRPIRVRAVRDDPSTGSGTGGLLIVEAADRTWTTRTLINATGTWTHPFVPHYPGQETFLGRQLHTVDYDGPEEMAGLHVVVVGGGASAIQLLGEIAPVAAGTTWVTRRPPVWRTEDFTPELGRAVVAKVEERVRQGLPPGSVSSVTGIALREQEREAEFLGTYDRRPMFSSIEPDGVRWSRGNVFQPADVILWATGFRPAIDHLAPLHLRSPRGGIQLDRTTAVIDPRIQLVGYGPSASTIGANRAGREAARGVAQSLAVPVRVG